MKIAFLTSTPIPSKRASSIQVMKMCQSFAGTGSEVYLLAREGRKSEIGSSGDLFRYYGVEPIFEIRTLRPINFLGRGLMTLGLRSGWELLKLQPDLVYGRSVLSSLIAVCLGYDLILEVHTTQVLKRRAFHWLIKNGNLRYLVAISQALKTRLESVAGDVPILVAHDGADPAPDPSGVSPPIDLSGFKDPVLIGYAGHLYPGKGGELISSLARLVPNLTFHVVGGTPDDIERTRQDAPGNVIFHGFLPPGRMAEILSVFDILLLPAGEQVLASGKKDDIGQVMSPLKLFEYMAVGKAILASDLPVLREVLRQGENALLVSPRDVNGWKLALEQLIANSGLREELGRRAKDDFLNKYTWDRRAERVLSGLNANRAW